MKYNVAINKRYQYIKVYTVLKKMQGNTNALSKLVSEMVEKYLIKKGPTKLE